MTRTIRRTIAFRRPFYLTGEDRLLPPGDYDVVTDEELIEGLSFSAYHRIDDNFRACAVWIRDREGNHRSSTATQKKWPTQIIYDRRYICS